MFSKINDPMIDEDLDEDITQYETIGESSTFRTANTKSAHEKTRSEYREETIEEIKMHFERPVHKPDPEPEPEPAPKVHKPAPEPVKKTPEPTSKISPEPTPEVNKPEMKKTGSIQMKSSSNNSIHSRRFPDSKPHNDAPAPEPVDDDLWQDVNEEKKPEVKEVKKPLRNPSYPSDHVMSRGEIMKMKSSRQDKVKAEKARKHYRRTNAILNILLILFIIIFIGSAGYLFRYYMKVREAESGFTTLRDEIPDSASSIEEIEKEFSPEEIIEDEETGLHYVDINGVQVQMKFVHLYRLNDHFIGWLNIPDTVIDYPVMYTPFEEEYYLHKDYNKQESASGTLFVAAKDDPLKPSDNVIIY